VSVFYAAFFFLRPGKHWLWLFRIISSPSTLAIAYNWNKSINNYCLL